jgi:hypothetical protein
MNLLKRLLIFLTLCLIMIFFSSVFIIAQERTIGLLIKENEAFEGYTLFAPLNSTTTFLIDINGNLVHSWVSNYKPGNSVYLLENGHLLRTGTVQNNVISGGGAGGKIQEFDWEGNLIWDFNYSSDDFLQHHDVEYLPNGNVLLVAWEYKTKAEAILAGRHPNLIKDNCLTPDCIVEIEPNGTTGGTVVWEWHIWDHLIQEFDPSRENYGVVANHPELLNINFLYCGNPNCSGADWNHVNAVDYNAELDQIIISNHEMSEIYIIDHSTTFAEAAGHTGGKYGKGGDFLYRWGNPQVYQAGSASDQKLFKQHDAQWIETGLPGAGNILIFNNGQGRPEGNFSSIDEIEPPMDEYGNYDLTAGTAYSPTEQSWIYTTTPESEFYSSFISGAHRLPNGNTLICSGANGRFFEVTTDKEIVWEYVNPVAANGILTQGEPVPVGKNNRAKNSVFRCYRYAPDYPGFAGKDIIPGGPIELYSTGVENVVTELPKNFKLFQNYPNPFNSSTTIGYQLSAVSHIKLVIYNVFGNKIRLLENEVKSTGSYSVVWDGKDNSRNDVTSGIYYYQLKTNNNFSQMKKLLYLK